MTVRDYPNSTVSVMSNINLTADYYKNFLEKEVGLGDEGNTVNKPQSTGWIQPTVCFYRDTKDYF